MQIESHPWEPFVPQGARILMLGTFPPGDHRWSMDFYYPNPTNDFWPMMGLILLGDRNALREPAGKRFDLNAIRALMTERHIALSDTARKVRRLRGNASDKYLDIVERIDLEGLLHTMPECRTVATTGEKAASVIAELTDTDVPKMGEKTTSVDGIDIWRMPSTSRAYPLALAKKAEYYAEMFRHAGIL
ncbi:MAG: uracil-DNA glycosylase family protein [Alistipes sp.]|nr:uracil-DNA glycosylase family protein [Alistipes sp.]